MHKYEDSREALIAEISKLIEAKAHELLADGMEPEDAYSCALEALEAAVETWEEEGQEVLGATNDELD
jgi:DNA-directed RNA polymerase specialized sigma subunit